MESGYEPPLAESNISGQRYRNSKVPVLEELLLIYVKNAGERVQSAKKREDLNIGPAWFSKILALDNIKKYKEWATNSESLLLTAVKHCVQ